MALITRDKGYIHMRGITVKVMTKDVLAIQIAVKLITRDVVTTIQDIDKQPI